MESKLREHTKIRAIVVNIGIELQVIYSTNKCFRKNNDLLGKQ